jgi:ABC-type Fe3+/spermidine/putrescine transport system ATPase subunit
VGSLEIQSLGVSYAGSRGNVTALSDFSLFVPNGGLTVLLGESGCGKSTALNSVAGLTQPNVGRIRLDDQVLFDGAARRLVSVPPNHRNVGMVFQSYALWPHLSVLANVMYPLLRRSKDKTEAERLALDALAMVRCDMLGHRIPGELSGGQQQRVALARALVARPKLLLFDEPLSNLDASLRRSLRGELAELHKEIGFTGLYVTHDQAEALALGTEIAVMDGGRIIQSGRPIELYEQPATEFVARFFGSNVVRGSANGASISTPFGQFESHSRAAGEVAVAFMPDAVDVEPDVSGPLIVKTATYLGANWEIFLANDRCEFMVIGRTRTAPPEVNSRVSVRIRPADLHAYPANEG